MKKEALKNEAIRRTGDKVLKAVQLSDEEIDRIVAAPQLFERVRTGIESARGPTEPMRSAFAWPRIAWAAFAALLLFAGTIAFVGISTQRDTRADLARTIREQVPPVEIPMVTPVVIELPEAATVPRKIIRASRETARIVKTKAATRLAGEPKEVEMGEFQALTYAGDPNEPGEGGRIVRVELSPASLFAMGVDVPVENETARIKTDLLIGADGVMKGVRVEKKD